MLRRSRAARGAARARENAYALLMTELEYGDIKVTATASSTELTTSITARERGDYKLRFEVETSDHRRIKPTDAEVSARFYLSNHLMYFTVGLPGGLHGANTLHVYADGVLDSSRDFTLPAA